MGLFTPNKAQYEKGTRRAERDKEEGLGKRVAQDLADENAFPRKWQRKSVVKERSRDGGN